MKGRVSLPFFIMKYLLFLVILSCSSLKIPSLGKSDKKNIELKNYSHYSSLDYIEHLQSYNEIYVRNTKSRQVPLSTKNKKYLQDIIFKITSSNELFFKDSIQPEFYIIKSKTPFHFSLPGYKFYFSTDLFKKYVKNETMLYCLFVYELVRSEKNIYEKKIVIPTGTLDTKRMLSLLRLQTEDKVEIHKWAFYLLKRIGLESDSYLTWLQIKNRNSLDFALQLGDIRSISREEALFKTFLIDNYLDKKSRTKYKGSSKSFYAFLRSI